MDPETPSLIGQTSHLTNPVVLKMQCPSNVSITWELARNVNGDESGNPACTVFALKEMLCVQLPKLFWKFDKNA